jgi:hypothetical protein
MNTQFDTIESGQEFLVLLREAVDEAKSNVESDITAESDGRVPRRLDALRLVLYKLDKLEHHLKASGRLFNDLRTLRRLLLEERADSAVAGVGIETKA